MKNAKQEQPTLFSLLTKLSPVERQKFGAKRRELKNQPGVAERLVEGKNGEWRLEYWKGKKKIGEMKV